MHRTFGKKDAALIGGLLAVCLVLLFFWKFSSAKDGTLIVITRHGKEYATYPLAEDATIEIKDAQGKTTNTLVISGGKADMTEADCPDKLCVRQKAVSKENETIVCLPNRIVVTVTNSKEEGMDGFAQ